jgi:hypothetical protein
MSQEGRTEGGTQDDEGRAGCYVFNVVIVSQGRKDGWMDGRREKIQFLSFSFVEDEVY